MKKAIKIAGIICVVIAVIIAICFAIPEKTLDFRGKVTDVKTDGDITLIYVSSFDTTFVVLADNKTKISYCCENDPSIDLSDVKIGDTIEGNYRLFSKDNIAKFITVQYHN